MIYRLQDANIVIYLLQTYNLTKKSLCGLKDYCFLAEMQSRDSLLQAVARCYENLLKPAVNACW